MTVNGSEFYMATEEFVGSNFYSPFVQVLPKIEWSGDGWLKTKAGQLTITNQPDEEQHPFGYSTNWNFLITNPDQQFPTAIHPGEPDSKNGALWFGYSVIRAISVNGLTFDLYENAKATALSNKRLVGNYSVSTLTAGNPTVLTVDNREMGGNTPSDYIKIGDFIQVNNTFSPVIADTNYLVTATSGNNISIDLDSTGTTFATPRVVTNSFDSGSGTQCILSKILTVPYVSFGAGATQYLIPRDRYYQDGFFGHYFFTPFQNWYPSPSSVNFKIFIDGVDETSNFTLATKSYKRTDGASYDGTITVETVTTYNTVFDLVDLLYSPTSATKAPNSDDSVRAGIMIEYSNDTDIEDFLDHVTKNTNYQFYVRYSSPTDSSLNGYLIDKANVPSATALDEFTITSTSFAFKQPTKAVSCEFTSRNISGTLGGDNFQFVRSSKFVSATNTDITSGAEIIVSQMHESLGQQLTYLEAILDVEKKLYITVTVDNINEDILPGDNLSFSREIDKVTVSSLLVRKIIYDMNQQTTQFCGDGTISMFERT
jgi:hypothetical protein